VIAVLGATLKLTPTVNCPVDGAAGVACEGSMGSIICASRRGGMRQNATQAIP